jgi:hypothetical protein
VRSTSSRLAHNDLAKEVIQARGRDIDNDIVHLVADGKAARQRSSDRLDKGAFLKTKYCLEEWVGLTVSEPPPLESFLASGGTNWDPWQEAIERYGTDAIGEICGRRLDLSYWEARSREAEEQEQGPLPPPSRDDFEAFYTFQRGLTACFETQGFPLPDPPSLESFIASGATNWSPLSQLIDLHPSASDADVWDQLEADCDALGLTFDEFRDS